MTLELALSAFLAGVVLGLRYKVVILIPAIVLVMLFAMIVGIARGDRFLSLFLAVAIPGAAIQIGYLAGAHIRAVVDNHLIKAFAPKRKLMKMKPPTTIPKEIEKASPNNQAPIIPPTAMLASNQKNQIASLKPAFRVRGRGTIVASVGNRRYAARTIRRQSRWQSTAIFSCRSASRRIQ